MKRYAKNYRDIIIKQLYLQKYGVSFDYSDKKTNKELNILVDIVVSEMEKEE